MDKRRVDPVTGQPKRRSIGRREMQYSDKGFETEEDLEGTDQKNRLRGRSGPRGENEFLTKSGKPD